MEQEKVIVIDFGGQYNQLVARRVRECNVYCEIYSYKTDIEKIKEMNPKGIILTGGSVIFGADAMAHFKESGIVVYLRISYDLLDERLGDLDERGVVHKEGQTLRDIYNERTALYEKYADITVDLDGKDVAGTVDAVVAQLEGK